MITVPIPRRRGRVHPTAATYLVLAFIVFAFVFAAGVWLLSGEPGRSSARREAARKFRLSRLAEFGSYDFFTRGIAAGMSGTEVDRLLLPADIVFRNGVDKSEDSPWSGVLVSYRYQYGTWHHPIFSIKKNLGTETILVYFDRDGRAQRISWSLYGEISDYYLGWQDVDIDLATKRMNRR